MRTKDINKLVCAYFQSKMSAEVRQAKAFATYDLYNGPMDSDTIEAEGYPADMTFTKAAQIVSNWCQNELCEIWIDQLAGLVEETEPQGTEDEDTGEYVEPFWEDYIHYDTHG